MKVEPKFPWIPVSHRVKPFVHVVIGVINDCVKYYETRVEYDIIKITIDEKQWRQRLGQLKTLLLPLEAAVNEWQQSDKGTQRRNLMARKRTRGATGFSNEPALKAQLDSLDNEIKALWKPRDDAKKEQKNLSAKVEDRISGRKTDKDAWHLQMEDIYSDCKITREDYHKRQFSGRPLRMLLDKASEVMNKAKDMLKDHLDPDKDEAIIAEVCNEVTEMLQSWRAVFKIVDKKSLAQEDLDDLPGLLETAIDHHRKVKKLLTPKAHTTEDHLIWQLRLHDHYPLLVEQFVELNHQIGSKLDSQTKHIVDVNTRANCMARNRTWDSHEDVQVQIRRVHEDPRTKRGNYKKKD